MNCSALILILLYFHSKLSGIPDEWWWRRRLLSVSAHLLAASLPDRRAVWNKHTQPAAAYPGDYRWPPARSCFLLVQYKKQNLQIHGELSVWGMMTHVHRGSSYTHTHTHTSYMGHSLADHRSHKPYCSLFFGGASQHRFMRTFWSWQRADTPQASLHLEKVKSWFFLLLQDCVL